jgi:hypothetical protein
MVIRKRRNVTARKVRAVLLSNRPDNDWESLADVVRTPKVMEAPRVETPIRPVRYCSHQSWTVLRSDSRYLRS